MDMMMETVLPVYLESLEEDDHYNMQLPDRMEQKIGVESARTVCKREMRPASLGNPIWNPNIATSCIPLPPGSKTVWTVALDFSSWLLELQRLVANMGILNGD